MENKENKESKDAPTSSNHPTTALPNEIPTKNSNDPDKDDDAPTPLNDLDLQTNLHNCFDENGKPIKSQTFFKPGFAYYYQGFREWVAKESDGFLVKKMDEEENFVMPSEENVQRVRKILMDAGKKINEDLTSELGGLKNKHYQLVAGSSSMLRSMGDEASNTTSGGGVLSMDTPESKNDSKLSVAATDCKHNIIIDETGNDSKIRVAAKDCRHNPVDETGNEAIAAAEVPVDVAENNENEQFGDMQWGYFTMITVTRPTKLGEELTFLIHHDEKIQILREQNSSVGESTIEVGDMWWYGLHVYLNNLQGEFSNQRYGKVYIKYVTLPNNPVSGFIDKVVNGMIKTYNGPLSSAPTNRVMNNIRLSKHEVCDQTDITSTINFADFGYEDFEVDTSEIEHNSFPEVLDTFKDVYPSQTFDLVVYQFRKTHVPRRDVETTTASVSNIDMEDLSIYFTPRMVICKQCWQIMDEDDEK